MTHDPMCHVRLSGIVRCGVSWSGYPRERLPVTVSSIHVITIRSKPTSLPANSTLCTYLPSPKLRGTLFLQPPLHLHDVVGVGRCIKEPTPPCSCAHSHGCRPLYYTCACIIIFLAHRGRGVLVLLRSPPPAPCPPIRSFSLTNSHRSRPARRRRHHLCDVTNLFLIL